MTTTPPAKEMVVGLVEVNQQPRHALCNREKHADQTDINATSLPSQNWGWEVSKGSGKGLGWGWGQPRKIFVAPSGESGKQQALKEGQKLQHWTPLLNPPLPRSVLSCPKERNTRTVNILQHQGSSRCLSKGQKPMCKPGEICHQNGS